MQTKKVTINLKEYKYIKKLMKEAFPKDELFPHWLLMINSLRKNVEFTAYYENEEFCAITYSVDLGDIFFVLYLAIDKAKRNHGYGSKILSHIKEEKKDKILVLDVEPLDANSPNYEQRLKRMEFYKRNDIFPTGYKVSEKNMSYSVLSTKPDEDISGYLKAYKIMTFGLYNGKIEKEE